MLSVILDMEETYQEAEIKKIVIEGIFQPLKITYKYRLHGDGVDVPTEEIKFCNADNGTDVTLLSKFNFSDIRKACYADAKKKLQCIQCDGTGEVDELDYSRVNSGTIEPSYKKAKCSDCDGTGIIKNINKQKEV